MSDLGSSSHAGRKRKIIVAMASFTRESVSQPAEGKDGSSFEVRFNDAIKIRGDGQTWTKTSNKLASFSLFLSLSRSLRMYASHFFESNDSPTAHRSSSSSSFPSLEKFPPLMNFPSLLASRF